MIEKLKEIISHFESLENKRADTALVNDQKLYTEMAKAVSYTNLTLPTICSV